MSVALPGLTFGDVYSCEHGTAAREPVLRRWPTGTAVIDETGETLRELVALHGESMLEDPARCRALLLDHCEGRLEVSLLTMALEEDIPRLLRSNDDGTPTAVLLDRLSRRFEAARGLAPASARWAVESWAVAVGVGQAPTLPELTERASGNGGPRTLAASPPPGTPTAAATAPPPADGPRPEPGRRGSRPWYRVPVVAIVPIVVLLLGVGAVVAFLTSRNPSTTTATAPTTSVTQAPTSSPSTTAGPSTSARPPTTPPTTIEPVGQVFTDDFSRPGSGWRVSDNPEAKFAYADGGYRVTIRRGNNRREPAPVETYFKPTGRFTNDALTIEAKVTFRPASAFVLAGLSCRGKPNYQGYRAHVRGDGYWSIFRFDGSDATGKMLAQATGPSDFASDVAGTGPHQLRLDCLGKSDGPVTLAFSVNGYRLKEVTDVEALPPGLINVSATLSAGAPTETADVIFDDFVVTRHQP